MLDPMAEPRDQNDTDRLIMALLLIVFPPLGVLVKSNGFSPPVFLSTFLYILFIIPSYVYSVWFCFVEQRHDSILPTNSKNFNNNLSLNSLSAIVSHKDVQVY